MRIEIEGVCPSKKNDKEIIQIPLKGGTKFNSKTRPSIVSSKRYQKWEKETVLYLKQFAPKKPIEKCLMIYYEFHYGDKVRRDLSNSVAGVEDALVLAGILKDDNWRSTSLMILNPRYKKGKPKVVIHIITGQHWWWYPLKRLISIIKRD